MSAKATAYVWENSPYKLADRLIHLAIADVANEQNGNRLWISQQHVADKAGVNRSTVWRCFAKMCDEGYLKLVEDNSSKNKPNVYEFLTPQHPQPTTEVLQDATLGVANARTEVMQDATPGDAGCNTNKRELKNTTKENKRNILHSSNEELFDADFSVAPSKAVVPPSLGKLPRGDNLRIEYPSSFEEIWKLSPRSDGKDYAYKSWRARLAAGEDPEKMIKAITNYTKYIKSQGTEKKFTRMMGSFFGESGPWREYVILKTDVRDPRQNATTDREGETTVIDIKELYRQRRAQSE